MKVDLSRYRNRHSFGNKARRLLWDVAYALLFRTMPRSRAMAWKRLLLRLFGARVAPGVRIESSATFWAPWNLTVGENAWIGGGARLYCVDAVTIGANAVVSQEADVCTASHDLSSPAFELTHRPIAVGDGAWIAARAAVLPGVRVGEGAVVGYGAVVTRDVPPWTVVAGNPAREVGKRILKDERLES